MVSSVPSQDAVNGRHPHLTDGKTGALRGSLLLEFFSTFPSVLNLLVLLSCVPSTSTSPPDPIVISTHSICPVIMILFPAEPEPAQHGALAATTHRLDLPGLDPVAL